MPDPASSTETSGFTEEERNELKALIAEAVGSANPPAGEPAKPELKRPTDDEWDAMSDRAKESWVRKLVDGRLDELAKEDEAAQLRAKVDALAAEKKEPEPEKAPSVVTKLQKFLWGEPKE